MPRPKSRTNQKVWAGGPARALAIGFCFQAGACLHLFVHESCGPGRTQGLFLISNETMVGIALSNYPRTFPIALKVASLQLQWLTVRFSSTLICDGIFLLCQTPRTTKDQVGPWMGLGQPSSKQNVKMSHLLLRSIDMTSHELSSLVFKAEVFFCEPACDQVTGWALVWNRPRLSH